jgi:hypothetical protein
MWRTLRFRDIAHGRHRRTGGMVVDIRAYACFQILDTESHAQGQIVEGCATICAGIVAAFLLVDSPDAAQFLRPDERKYLARKGLSALSSWVTCTLIKYSFERRRRTLRMATRQRSLLGLAGILAYLNLYVNSRPW